MHDLAAKQVGLNQLAERIAERTGIRYAGNLSSLETKLQGRLAVLGLTHGEYLDYILRTPEEWDELISCVTVNETYFFREESQLDELVATVLPSLQHKESIHIWSAACSTGEEPYSIAMKVLESGVLPLERVHIYASDINRRVLDTARQGRYARQSFCFRKTPEYLLNKYFVYEESGDRYRIADRIRERVRFCRVNLVHPPDYAKLPPMDVIFCRNVLIYFDQATCRQVIKCLSYKLADGGYLFLGHAETLAGCMEPLHMIHKGSSFFYRKGVGHLGASRSVGG